MRALVIILAAALSACGTQKEYVPVAVERTLPPLAGECKVAPAKDLPAPPPLPGESIDAVRVNAHWAGHWARARKLYRKTADDYSLCQRWAQSISKG